MVSGDRNSRFKIDRRVMILLAQMHFILDRLRVLSFHWAENWRMWSRNEDIYIKMQATGKPRFGHMAERFRVYTAGKCLGRADLIGDEYLVEMEAEAIIDDQ